MNYLKYIFFNVFPYLLLTYIASIFFDGNKDFWELFLLILGFRFVFYITDTFGQIIAWRLHTKKTVIDGALSIFRKYKFPQRYYAHDTFSAYLYRVLEGEIKSKDPKVLEQAKLFEHSLQQSSDLGILVEARLNKAYEEAYDLYAPPSNATNFLKG
jgi:hypothetical protein